MTDRKPIPLSELVRCVGDDNIFVQNLLENTTNIRAHKRGVSVTFQTGSHFCSPNDALDLNTAKYVGLVIWLPREDVERVRHD